MVQVPPVSGMTVAPETVHAGEGAVTSRAPARKDTASPEVAWADTTKGTPATARAGPVKPTMDCCPFPAGWTSKMMGRLAGAKSCAAALGRGDRAGTGGQGEHRRLVHRARWREVQAGPGSGADGHGQAGGRGDGQVPGHADGLHGRRAGRQARPAGRPDRLGSRAGLDPNERCTSRAAAKRALPPCIAVILQRPPARVSTVVPDTAHTSGVSEWNDTARPEDAEAGSVTGSPAVMGAPVPSGRRNVIPCDSGPVPIWKARAAPGAPEPGVAGLGGGDHASARPDGGGRAGAGGAGAGREPATGEAETLHTAGVSDRNVTGSPDDAQARSGTRAPTCAPEGGGKETS